MVKEKGVHGELLDQLDVDMEAEAKVLEKINEAREAFSVFRGAFDSLLDKDPFKGRLGDLKEGLDDIREMDLDEIEALVGNIKNAISDVENALSEEKIKSGMEDIKERARERRRKIRDLNGDFDDLKEEINSFEEEFGAGSWKKFGGGDLDGLLKEIEEAEKSDVSMRKLNALHEKIKEGEKRLDQIKEERERETKKEKERPEEEREFGNALESLNGAIKKLESRIDVIEEKFGDSEGLGKVKNGTRVLKGHYEELRDGDISPENLKKIKHFENLTRRDVDALGELLAEEEKSKGDIKMRERIINQRIQELEEKINDFETANMINEDIAISREILSMRNEFRSIKEEKAQATRGKSEAQIVAIFRGINQKIDDLMKRATSASAGKLMFEGRLDRLMDENRDIIGEVRKENFDEVEGVDVFENSSVEEKIMMILEGKVAKSRKKYFKKDYEMDKKLGKLKRFFGTSVGSGLFEKELESYKIEYQKSLKEYQETFLDINQAKKEEMEKLVRYFSFKELLNQESTKDEVALEENSFSPVMKKIIVDTANNFNKILHIPRELIEKVFTGPKILSAGVGMVVTSKLIGVVYRNIPVLRGFSAVVTAVGVKKTWEKNVQKMQERKAEKISDKLVSETENIVDLKERTKRINVYLEEINDKLTQGIQNRKVLRQWRTIVSAMAGVGAYYLPEFVKLENIWSDAELEGASESVIETPEEIGGGTEKIIEEPAPLPVESAEENLDEILPEAGTFEKLEDTPAESSHVELEGGESPEAKMSDEDLEMFAPAGDEIFGSDAGVESLSEQEFFGINSVKEIRIAQALGLGPNDYAVVNDVSINDMLDRKTWYSESYPKLSEFFERVRDEEKVPFMGMETVSEFFSRVDLNNLPVEAGEVSVDDLDRFHGELISHEKDEMMGKIKDMYHSELREGEAKRRLEEFHERVSRLNSEYRNEGEGLDEWLRGVTSTAYKKDQLNIVKDILRRVSYEDIK